jgi:acetolactate synthase-1/2/3 large subunit
VTSVRPLSTRTPFPRDLTASQLAVAALVERGVTDFFGVPGGPIIPFFDAILSNPETTLYEPRHETTAVFEAMGFHRATQRTPVVVVTAGPGLTNVVTGVAAAMLERIPLLVVCGDVAWSSTGERMLQDSGEGGLAAERMLGSVTRMTTRIARAESAASQMLAALSIAEAPVDPGPALVVFPIDRSAQRKPGPMLAHAVRRVAIHAPPDPSTVASVEQQLRRAQRPLLVLGGACRSAQPTIEALVNALGIPFMTTPRAKGIVSEEHPLSLRTSGMAASWWARRYTQAGVDACLALGTDLDDVSVLGTPLVARGGTLTHVDLDASVIGRGGNTTLGVIAELGGFASALFERARQQNSLLGIHERGRALADEVHAQSAFDVPDFATDDAPLIRPHRVLADLEAAAPDNTRFVTDIGEHMLFALHYLTARRPDAFTIHLGLGSMGSGIGSAVGQALGDPSRPVCCICGDGGMAMVGMELLTAVQHRLPVLFVVFNDARYNMVYHGYRQTFGREASWSTPHIDFVAWARSLGANGERIDHPGEIGPEHFLGLKHGPMVLDVRQDPGVRIKGEGRVEAIRQMSMSTKEV